MRGKIILFLWICFLVSVSRAGAGALALEKEVVFFHQKSGLVQNIEHFNFLFAGYLLGIISHEAAHGLHLFGEEIRVRPITGNWWCLSCSEEKMKRAALAPFSWQILSNEFLFAQERSLHPFEKGLVLWNIVNPIWYTLLSEVKGGHGDLAHFKEGERRVIEAVITAHALHSAYRLIFGKELLPLHVVPTERGDMTVSLVFRW